MDWYWTRSSIRSSVASGKTNKHSSSTRRITLRRRWGDRILETKRWSSKQKNEYSQYWSDDVWKSQMAGGGGNKKRFQNCADPSGREFFLSPSSSRSFRTQSHWSYTLGQCVNSRQFLWVHLSYWMCNQFTLHHKFRIDSGRTQFYQWKTDGILYSRESLRITGIRRSLISPYHVLHRKSKSGKDTKRRCIGSKNSLLNGKDWSSIKQDQILSSSMIHSQLLVSRKRLLFFVVAPLFFFFFGLLFFGSFFSLSWTTWYRKGAVMVLDKAKPKNKQSTTWLGMRGRDAARMSTLQVDILQVFTIDFSEIQSIVNHNSQSDGQNKSAKSGMNLHKKTIHIISLQRKRKDTKDNGILPWTKQPKMGLWNFDLIFEPLSRWKIVYTTHQENKLKSVSIQINKDDGIHIQVHRGGTSLNGIGSELIKSF